MHRVTRFMRSRAGRVTITSLIGFGSLLLGIFGGQALGGDETQVVAPEQLAPNGSASEAPPTSEVPVIDGPLPILGSIAELPSGARSHPDLAPPTALLASDPLEGADLLDGDSGPHIIGAIEVDDIATEPDDAGVQEAATTPSPEPEEFVALIPPITYDSIPRAIDPCAGNDDETPPASCPPGVGSTVLSSSGLTPPTLGVSVGDRSGSPPDGLPSYLSCPVGFGDPGPGETAAAVWSSTPLETITIRYRPYESDAPWQTITPTPAAHPEHEASWYESYIGLEKTVAVIRCFNVPRDPATAYEVEASGEDIFDRSFRVEGIFGATDPQRRPRTTASVDVFNQATIRAFSRDGGRAVFYWSVAHDLSFLPDCTVLVEDTAVESRPGIRPGPVGLVDPSFDRAWRALVDIPPGQSIHVCVEIYESTSSSQIIAVDQMLLHSYSELVPEVWITGVSLVPPEGTPTSDLLEPVFGPGGIQVTADGGPDCTSSKALDEVGYFTGVDQRHRLWSCAQANNPPRALRLSMAVRPLATPQDRFADSVIQFADRRSCVSSCYQPSTVHPFAIPAGAPGTDSWLGGIVWLQVDYVLVPGTGSGRSVEYVSEEDIGESDELQFRFDRTALTRGDDLMSNTELTLLSSRPVTVTGVTVVPTGTEDPSCNGSVSSPSGTRSTAETLAISGLCPGVSYDFVIDAVDEGGLESQVRYWTRRSDPGALGAALEAGGSDVDFPGPLRVPPVTITAMVEIEYDSPAEIDLRLPSLARGSTPFVWRQSAGSLSNDRFLCGLGPSDQFLWSARTRWPAVWTISGSRLMFTVDTNAAYADDDCGMEGAFPPIHYGSRALQLDVPLERLNDAEIEFTSTSAGDGAIPRVTAVLTLRVLDVS